MLIADSLTILGGDTIESLYFKDRFNKEHVCDIVQITHKFRRDKIVGLE